MEEIEENEEVEQMIIDPKQLELAEQKEEEMLQKLSPTKQPETKSPVKEELKQDKYGEEDEIGFDKQPLPALPQNILTPMKDIEQK